MNRTDSDGHETLRSLLLHTGDPLPLVLALDGMDPDDPLTQHLAGQLVAATHKALQALYTEARRRGPLPPALDRDWTRVSAHISTPTTPADSLPIIQQDLANATKAGGHLTLRPYDRYHLAAILPGPPVVFIQGDNHLQTTRHRNLFITLSSANQKEAPQILEHLELNLLRGNTETAGNVTMIHAIFRGHSYDQALRLALKAIRQALPDAHIIHK